MSEAHDTRLLRADQAPTATAGAAARRPSCALPADMVGAACERLSRAALIYAAVYFVAYLAARLTGGGLQEEGGLVTTADWISFGWIALSLAVFLLARSRRIHRVPQRALDIGLVYMVIGAFGIDGGWIWYEIPPGFRITGISWACVWIALFPMIVPNWPAKTLAAALVAASMLPLSVTISLGRGGVSPGPHVLLNWFLPNYVCAVLAYASARIVHRWHCDVNEARELGSYHLVARIGNGGMGEVWRARHRLLARPAAVKLIRPEALGIHGSRGGDVAVRRFEREAKATAFLRSQHTVELYDFGRTDDGTFYYVMELLEGRDLESLVGQFGPLPAERVVDLLVQVCDSLADAHQHGLIHRDIKPANIYVCRLGIRYDVAKVLDFGLVKKANSAAGPADVRLTTEGLTTGTPAFMPPEIGLGQPEIDGRADLYSLGCVGYYLLTGQLVFEAASPMQMVVEHVNTPPPPPSQRTELPIPEALEAIIMTCLAKEPDARPQAAKELALRLAACDLPRPWTQERAERWWHSHLPRMCNQPVAAAERETPS